MAHEIEYKDGRYSFAFVGDRSAIWHRKGQQMIAGASPAEWQSAAGHNFQVDVMPLAGIPDGEVSPVPVATHRLLYRTDTGAALSVIGKDWTPAQNIDAYKFAQPLIDEGFCSMNTAGTLFQGKLCFILLKTKEGFQLPGGDETQGYILVQISHESGHADLVTPVAIRVVCDNTRRFALESKTKAQIEQGKFIHTKKTSFSVEKAHALIAAYRAGLGQYAEQAKFLATRKATPEQTRAYINKVFKLEELQNAAAAEVAKRREHNARVVKQLTEAIERQPGAHMSPGTWWSNFHAVTFWEDHGRHEKKTLEPLASKFRGVAADRKDYALKVALEMAS